MDNYEKVIWKRHKSGLILGLIIVVVLLILQWLGVITL